MLFRSGQKIETSLLQTALTLHTLQMLRVEGVAERGAVRMVGPRAAYLCSDGRWVLDTTMNIRAGWDTLCDVFPLVELLADERFLTPEGRLENAAEIEAILAKQFLTKTAAEWEVQLKGMGHTASIVNEIDDVFNDPQEIGRAHV